MPISVSLALMPGTLTPVLAVGGDDAKIRIFCYTSTAVAADGEGKGGGQGGAATFQLMTTLTGHEDWVRSLTFATGTNAQHLWSMLYWAPPPRMRAHARTLHLSISFFHFSS